MKPNSLRLDKPDIFIHKICHWGKTPSAFKFYFILFGRLRLLACLIELGQILILLGGQWKNNQTFRAKSNHDFLGRKTNRLGEAFRRFTKINILGFEY